MVQGLKESFCRSILACRVVPALPATHKVGRRQRAASLRPLDPIVARTLIQNPLILRRRLVRDLSTLEMGANPCSKIMHAILAGGGYAAGSVPGSVQEQNTVSGASLACKENCTCSTTCICSHSIDPHPSSKLLLFSYRNLFRSVGKCLARRRNYHSSCSVNWYMIEQECQWIMCAHSSSSFPETSTDMLTYCMDNIRTHTVYSTK